MFIVGLLQWWYGAGWRGCMARAGERLLATADFFSIDLLLTSLFAPFRQIAVGKVQGSLEVQFRAFIDLLMSRLIGAMVRTFLIVAGSVSLAVVVLSSLLLIVGWLVVPLLPLLGLGATVTGYMPW